MTEGISLTSSNSVNYAGMLNNAANAGSNTSDKTTDEIIQELKQDGMSSTKSAQEIADEYGISLSKAQQILEELEGTENETSEELPEDSTVSYLV